MNPKESSRYKIKTSSLYKIMPSGSLTILETDSSNQSILATEKCF